MLSATEWNWGESSTVQAATGTTRPGATRTRRRRFVTDQRDDVHARASRQLRRLGRNWCQGWAFTDLLPYFKRSETALGHDPALRGTDGPLVVAPADPPNEYWSACRAAVESGFPARPTSAVGLEVGFGPVDLNIVDGRRQTAADAYLSAGVARPNVEMPRRCWFTACSSRAAAASGSSAGQNGTATVARADEVILAAGAIGSPEMLMRPASGRGAHLREVGIDVQLDLPGVGTNLQDHAWVMVAYRAGPAGCPRPETITARSRVDP